MKWVAKALSAGALPYSALCVMLGLAFYCGRISVEAPKAQVAVAERSRVILEAVMDRSDMPRDEIEAQVLGPIQAVLSRYRDQGYVVIDTARDENGNFMVAALPDSARDITKELQTVVALKRDATK